MNEPNESEKRLHTLVQDEIEAILHKHGMKEFCLFFGDFENDKNMQSCIIRASDLFIGSAADSLFSELPANIKTIIFLRAFSEKNSDPVGKKEEVTVQ